MRAGKPWRSRKAEEAAPAGLTIADMFRQRFGWSQPARKPFHTSANRQCSRCRTVKPGADFDCPVTPVMGDAATTNVNQCRDCEMNQ